MAGAATRFTLHDTALSQLALQALPADVAPYLQVGVWLHVIGVEAAMPVSSLLPLTRHCAASDRAKTELPPSCTAVARVMAQSSNSALATLIGLRMAERTFMKKEDAQRERELLKQAMQTAVDPFEGPQPYGCAQVARLRSWLEQRAALGEMGMFRAAAAARAAGSSAASSPR